MNDAICDTWVAGGHTVPVPALAQPSIKFAICMAALLVPCCLGLWDRMRYAHTHTYIYIHIFFGIFCKQSTKTNNHIMMDMKCHDTTWHHTTWLDCMARLMTLYWNHLTYTVFNCSWHAVKLATFPATRKPVCFAVGSQIGVCLPFSGTQDGFLRLGLNLFGTGADGWWWWCCCWWWCWWQW